MLYSDVMERGLFSWHNDLLTSATSFPLSLSFHLKCCPGPFHNRFIVYQVINNPACYETFVSPDIFWPNYAFPLCCLTPPSLSAGIVSLWGNPCFQQASADQPIRDQSMGRELGVCSVLANGIACVGCGIKSSLTSELCFRQCEVAGESLCALRHGVERISKGGRETRNEGKKQRGG